jgi:hypothetical protein
MKAIGTLSAKTLLACIAAGFALTAFNSASAADVSTGLQAGQGAYVQNLINDSKQRGLSCEMSMHVPACLAAYCSSCAGHSGLMESCMSTGMAYFTNSCSPQPTQLTAYNMPAPGAWF